MGRAPVRHSVNFDNLGVRHIASRYVEVKSKAPAFHIRTKQKRHKKSLPLVFTTRGLWFVVCNDNNPLDQS